MAGEETGPHELNRRRNRSGEGDKSKGRDEVRVWKGIETCTCRAIRGGKIDLYLPSDLGLGG